MLPLNWQKRAILEVGEVGNNAIYEVALPLGATSGTWRLGFGGVWSAALPLAVDADGLELLAEAVSTVGAGNLHVSGVPKGPFRLELLGALGGQVMPSGWLVADGALLVPSGVVSVVRVQNGSVQSLSELAAQYWDGQSETMAPYERFLNVKLGLLRVLMARFAGDVDGKDGDAEAKESQRFKHFQTLFNQTKGDLMEFQTTRVGSSSGATQTGALGAGAAAVQNYEVAKLYGRTPFPFR